ncbi:MAG: glycoside hydrolase domain-containing protein [Ferruginibacter sp.]
MNKFISVKLILLLFITCCRSNTNAQNAALGKPYTLSLPPNYNTTSKDADRKVLTDGIYANTAFWNTDTTAGWNGAKKLGVDIDLLNPTFISAVTLNTARKDKAGVFYPSNIFVFTSLDKKRYSYAGDLSDDIDNKPGGYTVKKFILSNIDQSGRYVKFVIIPKGTFIFSDEIEVLEGKTQALKSIKTIPQEDINAIVDSLLKITSQIERIDQTANREGKTTITKKGNLNNKLNQVRVNRLNDLKLKFANNVIIDSVNPWSKLTYPYQPVGTKINSYRITTMTNGVQYGAFVITNLVTAERVFNCSVQSKSKDIASTELFQVPFIVSGNNYEEIADPLVGNTKKIRIPPGESCVLMFKVTGKSSGISKAKIIIKSGTYSSGLLLDISISKQKFSVDSLSLNAVNWAYFNYPLISDRNTEALSDLYRHHINTMVVPPYKLPFFNKPDEKEFGNYIAGFKSARNILLFMDFKSKLCQQAFENAEFLSEEWKANFVKWYKAVVESSGFYGIEESQLYIYPFDEIKDSDVNSFATFLKWLNKNYPNIKTYATLTSVNAVKTLQPLLTISQILDEKPLLDAADDNIKNIWTYTTTPRAESLSPYSFYRLKAWRAFFNNYNGIGFWNYADYRNGSTNKTQLTGFDGVNANNYSVIYNGPGKAIISSRRWEAFMLGIEDYELLMQYSRKNGFLKARQLAGKIIQEPENIKLADLIRDQLLESL